ncbi:MAG: translocation/assembly module TamB domain-containing protein [bacterium]
MLERPLEGLTGLDIFRLEASDPDSKNLSSLVVGKRLTERLSLEFKTDLSIEESIKSVQAEYQLLDNVLLLGSRSSSGKYRLDLTFRFRGF